MIVSTVIEIAKKEVEFSGRVEINQCDIDSNGLPVSECVCTDFWTESMEAGVLEYVNKSRSKIRAALEKKAFNALTHAEED